MINRIDGIVDGAATMSAHIDITGFSTEDVGYSVRLIFIRD